MAEIHSARNPEKRHRLFFLATSLAMRGMEPEDAYEAALFYVDGPGRGRTWVSALAEYDFSASDRPPLKSTTERA
jgi:hypothetical protein